jgi:hypothetical protein
MSLYKYLIGELVEVCTDHTEEQSIEHPDTGEHHNVTAGIAYSGYLIDCDKTSLALGYYDVEDEPVYLMVIEITHIISTRVVKEESPVEDPQPVLQ